MILATKDLKYDWLLGGSQFPVILRLQKLGPKMKPALTLESIALTPGGRGGALVITSLVLRQCVSNSGCSWKSMWL